MTDPLNEATLSDLWNYAEPTEDLDLAIRKSMLEFVLSEFLQKDFQRFNGAGLELMENGADDQLKNILIRARIVEAIAVYNSTVTAERQVIVSQQSVLVFSAGEPEVRDLGLTSGTLYVQIRYFPVKDLGRIQGNAAQDAIFPLVPKV